MAKVQNRNQAMQKETSLFQQNCLQQIPSKFPRGPRIYRVRGQVLSRNHADTQAKCQNSTR